MKIIIWALLFLMFLGGAWAQPVVLSGTQSSYRLLSNDSCYLIEGCYVVQAPNILEIEPGTLIKGEKASLGTLIIERGAQLQAAGTSNAPIIFTTDQIGGNKAAGDWGGIVLLGYAPNNVTGGTFDVLRCGVNYPAGGTDSMDNSGVLSYVRIEFAGGGTDMTTPNPTALLLGSVGMGTTLEYVQTSYSGRGGYLAMGGTFEAHHLISFNDLEVNYRFTLGNKSKLQYLLGLRMDANAHTGNGYKSNGLVIENDDLGSSNTPITGPNISNMTLLGRGNCGEDNLHSDIEHAIKWDRNGAGNIWNSTIAGYRLFGVYLDDAGSVAHTTGNPNLLNFSFNSLKDNQSPQYGDGGWSTGCSGSMQDWIEGLTSSGCEESDNDFGLTSFGYHGSVCSVYCSTRPVFTYSGTDLEGTDFSGVFSDDFFDNNTTVRGGVQSDDWPNPWAKFCAEDYVCPEASASSSSGTLPTLQFVPNPATGNTTLVFDAPAAGKAQIVVMDKISGRALLSMTTTIAQPGTQRIVLSLDSLRDDVYAVQLTLDGQVWQGKLSVQ